MKPVKLKDTKLIHKNLLHFYTLTTKDQKEELRKQSHLSSDRKRIPRSTPTQETMDLSSENCKMLMKEIEDDTDGKIHHILGLEESLLSK